ncbi:aspartyl-phosphate phosphatase Spo0E family protein [Bacillus songklensis]|uniref:Aspartyl-phosphate phosphatase Spo0E family protein n=1 Tax=Bacillus songklensis TaxID=1069116 RepID=A0ABV8AZJ1_9BACI
MFKHDILQEIEKKREELIRVVQLNGFSSHQTIRHSQELDALLNLYNERFLGQNTVSS